MKKYTVGYWSRSTGFGWSEELDKIYQVENLIGDLRRDIMASIEVYDNELGDFIYIKPSRTFTAEKDLIYNSIRDLRTKDRMII